MEIKTVSIIGMGALGITYGSEFLRALPPVPLRFIADKARIERYRAEGVFCNGKQLEFNFIEPGQDVAPADLLIFATKTTALAAAIEDARSQVGADTTIISVLNGVDSEQELGRAFGAEKILLCVAQGMDSTRIGNQLTCSTRGLLQIGVVSNSAEQNERLQAVAAFFDRVGRSYEIVPDMPRQLWSKFMLNCGANQASAVYGATYRDLQNKTEARAAMLAAMREVLTIAQAQNIDLTEKDVDYWLAVLATLGAEGRTSMGQDALAKRKSEVETFSGTVLRLGNELGISTPVNQRFHDTIHAMEKQYANATA
ncbi:MAG: 2-dehydropantoate 2-reductase [Coriobacteriales bacterium]|jgi:2-dehydropantoate 2-reductase|nr:2-dehydropantoate 2-reductase [Coriobacteriales bacterium]